MRVSITHWMPMESRRGSTWIRFNGGNGCTVSPQSNPLYGQRSPVIYGKKTDASEGGSGTQRWLDRFFWVMQRPSIALNSSSPGSRRRWLSAAVLPQERRRMRTYFQWANWKKMILMAVLQAKFVKVHSGVGLKTFQPPWVTENRPRSRTVQLE